MKNFLQKYVNHKIIFEIVSAVFMVFLFGMICFKSFLQEPWQDFLSTHHQYLLEKNKLAQKKLSVLSEKNIALSLKNWRTKHPNFYHAIKNMSATHDISEILTKIIQQSQFIITHVSSHHADNTVNVKATGNFLDLLTLLSELNQNPLPLTLTQLSIDHVNQFDFQFLTRAHHAKK